MDNSTPVMSELLVRYLDDELDKTEKEDLEQKIAADKSLQEELENLRLSREAIRYYGLKEKVSGMHRQMMKEMRKETPVKQISSTRSIIRFSIAVAASVLIIFLGFKAYDYFTLSSDRIFANNYQSYDLPTFRGKTEKNIFEKAYSEKNYNEVITLYQSANPEDIQANFLTGLSHLELNEYDKAIVNFKRVLELNRLANATLWQDQSEYYLALTYLKTKEYTSSIELLQKIYDDPEHTYHEKVTARLLRRVKRLERK